MFCGAGIAADGYIQAGFTTIGVDVDRNAEKYYPSEFHEGDAMDILNSDYPNQFDVIHASPPCQLFTRAGNLRTAQGNRSRYLVDLLTPTIEILKKRWSHKTWVVENVEGAKSLMYSQGHTVKYCGSAFNLEIQKHRLFTTNHLQLAGTVCNHKVFPIDPFSGRHRPWGIYHVPGDNIPKGGRTALTTEHALKLMGVKRDVPWAFLKEGIPPSYTFDIGEQILSDKSVRGYPPQERHR